MSRARDNADLGDSYGSLAVGVTGGSGLNALSASNLSAGTVPDARFPATLPAASGTNLTALPAANVTGVLPVGVTGGSGLTALGTVATGNLSNTAIVYPAGHVIGMWTNSRGTSAVTITNSGGTSTNTDGLIGVDTGNRLYAEELSVAVNVSSTTSDLFVIGTVGVGNMSWSNKGAYGMVLNIPSPTTNYAYDSDNYPFYGAKTSFGDVTSSYGIGKTVQASVKGSDSLVKSGSYNIKIYVYAYNESNPGGSQAIQTQNSDITVFEIQR